MKTFIEYLVLERWTEVPLDIGGSATTVRVMKNPHPNVLKKLIRKHKDMRYTTDANDDLYVWDSMDATHEHIESQYSAVQVSDDEEGMGYGDFWYDAPNYGHKGSMDITKPKLKRYEQLTAGEIHVKAHTRDGYEVKEYDRKPPHDQES